MTNEGGASGLLGKLLLPGYADAGANASFRRAENNDDSTGNHHSQQQQQLQLHGTDGSRDSENIAFDGGDDHGSMNLSTSDAQTEILDNRTSTRRVHNDARHNDKVVNDSGNGNGNVSHPHSSMHHANHHDAQGHADSKFGFFPSTNRSILRQASHDQQFEPAVAAITTTAAATTSVNHNHEDMLAEPPSPPEVTRHQLIDPSIAATSVVPQIGGLVDALQDRASLNEYIDRNDNVHGTSIDGRGGGNELDDELAAAPSEVLTTTASTTSTLLGTQFLQKVKPMSETEHERDDLRAKLHQTSSGIGGNHGGGGSGDSHKDGRGNGNGNRSVPLSPSSALQGSLLDRTVENDERDGSHSEVNSTVLSEANSTASEMGTIINIANNKQRMAEVEAMAALVEASPAFQEYDAPYGAYDASPNENIAAALALPTLEGGDGGNNTNNSSSKNNHLGTIRHQRISQEETTDSQSHSQSQSQSQVQTHDTRSQHPNISAANSRNLMDTSKIMSSSIKRLGSGISSKKRSLTLSAPPTPVPNYLPDPPRVEDLLKSSQSPKRSIGMGNSSGSGRHHPPPSFALRSPGSAARHELSTSMEQEKDRPSNARRLLKQNRRRDLQIANALNDRVGTTSAEATPHAPLSTRQLAFTGPFRLAQKCFSFDSTLDDRTHTIPLPSIPATKTKAWAQIQREQNPGPRTQNNDVSDRILRQSTSWDVGWSRSAQHSTILLDPNTPHRRIQPTQRLYHTQRGHNEPTQRIRLHSDFSPATKNSARSRVPKRVEIEREDALDILACLVERGVSLERNDKMASARSEPSKTESKDDGDQGNEDDDNNNDDDDDDGAGDDFVAAELKEDEQVEDVIDEIKKEIETLKETNPDRHAARITAIDVLSRSHSYAMEMKRASLSASTWLKSIGKSEDSATHDNGKAQKKTSDQIEGGQASSESGDLNESNGIGSTGSIDKIEITTLKALLHTAQLEAKDRAEQADKLNEELSKCRAEIGRLQSASKSESMALMPSRSIMDDAEDSNDGKSQAGAGQDVRRNTRALEKRSPSPILDDGSEADLSLNNSLFRGMEVKNENAWRKALGDANKIISSLHSDLRQFKEVGDSPPTVIIENVETVEQAEGKSMLQQDSDGSASKSIDEMNRTVNVRMLDGENFVTEWGDLTPPLPPPPDHGLRSPIVQTVLSQWTSDGALHDSLMSWIESILSGANLDAIPPLTISSLDHQVRDGFSMHVLPLLLRRADVHLNVQTRAHRRTTYDMAVTVGRKTQIATPFSPTFQSLQDRVVDDWAKQSTDFEQQSTTHSAVTAHISNSTSTAPIYSNSNLPSGDAAINQLTDGRSVKSASSHDEFPDEFAQSNQGIMGAIGGAIGGLLSRRTKPTNSPSRGINNSTTGHHPFSTPMRGQHPAPILENLPDGMHDVADVALEEQPYHRVVVAPPGRIGMTFVEFRGHAMVSDVAPNSPLSGWVFPSDILIAIDEIPVSGMRVRDIIKVLTNRKDRQRALRVISSHAMNEFTLSQTHFHEGPPS